MDIYICVCLSVCLSVCVEREAERVSMYLYTYICVYVYIRTYVFVSICLSVCLSVGLSVYLVLSVCVFFRFLSLCKFSCIFAELLVHNIIQLACPRNSITYTYPYHYLHVVANFTHILGVYSYVFCDFCGGIQLWRGYLQFSDAAK